MRSGRVFKMNLSVTRCPNLGHLADFLPSMDDIQASDPVYTFF
jgi:hypothetical protein